MIFHNRFARYSAIKYEEAITLFSLIYRQIGYRYILYRDFKIYTHLNQTQCWLIIETNGKNNFPPTKYFGEM